MKTQVSSKPNYWLWLKLCGGILFTLLITTLYFNRVSNYAPGLFCDEAEIGLQAKRFLKGNEDVFINPFFYSHYEYILGSLPVIAAIPFVFLFDITEWSIRLSSLFFGALTLLAWTIWLHKNRWPKIGIVWLSITPLFFHVVHLSFGHSISLFLISLGYMSFANATANETRQKHNLTLLAAGCSGLLIGLASYGYGMFQLAAPLLIGSLWLSELFAHRLNWRKYLVIFVVTITAILAYLPLVHQATTNPVFWERFQQKTKETQVNSVSMPALIGINSLKYFSPTYLWWNGEATEYKGGIKRHGLIGIGVYSLLSLPLLIAAFFGWKQLTASEKRIALPMWFFWWLSPLGGILTTNLESGAYSFAIVPQLICVPILASAGWLILSRHKLYKIKSVQVLCQILAVVFILAAFQHLAKAQKTYPKLSADYWGWQYSMKEIAPYMQSMSTRYDAVYVTELFNQPQTLLEFYSPNQQICSNCSVGNIDNYDPSQQQLFILRTEELESALKNFEENTVLPNLKTTFQLPNGETAFVALEFAPIKTH